MKSELNFRAGALVLGLALAISGSAYKSAEAVKNHHGSPILGWFATNPDGSLATPYQRVDPDDLCHGDDVSCAKQYNIENGEPVSETGLEAKRSQLEFLLENKHRSTRTVPIFTSYPV